MLASDQLDASGYPEITFASTGCSGDGAGALTVVGELTIRGRSASAFIPVDYQIDGDRFYAQGDWVMLHADFGITPFSAYAGAVANAEDLDFHFDVVGQ